MNFKEPISILYQLEKSGICNFDTYSQAKALIDKFRTENRDLNGSIVDDALEEKIFDVEMYFQNLYDLHKGEFDEDGFDEEGTRINLRSSIDKLGLRLSILRGSVK